MLQANLGDKGGRPLASYNPITIDRCLGKAMGNMNLASQFETAIC